MPAFHTLTHGATTVQIPRGLVWSDEFDWAPVDSVSERGITGALIVDAASKTAGRPITLASIRGDQGYISRSVLLSLLTIAETPLAELTLTLATGGTPIAVMFAPGQQPIEAEVIGSPEVPNASTQYTATVRLVTI